MLLCILSVNLTSLAYYLIWGGRGEERGKGADMMHRRIVLRILSPPSPLLPPLSPSTPPPHTHTCWLNGFEFQLPSSGVMIPLRLVVTPSIWA